MELDNVSLLTRNESVNLKGLLILLVVLGHNNVIMQATGLYSFIYSFHVYCFYILPFTYGVGTSGSSDKMKVKWLVKRIMGNIKRYYFVYLVWTIVSICISHWLYKHSLPSPSEAIHSFIFGDCFREIFGVGFLWFLPTMVSVLLWKDIFFLSSKYIRLAIFLVGIFLWGLSIAGVADYRILGRLLPFYIILGLYFSVLGISCRWLLQKLPKYRTYPKCGIIGFFIIIAFISIRRFLFAGCMYLSWSLVPIIAFCCIYQFKRYLTKARFLEYLGNYSMGIYLLHVFIYNALKYIIPSSDLMNGLLLFFLTLAITLLMLIVMEMLHLEWLYGAKRSNEMWAKVISQIKPFI